MWKVCFIFFVSLCFSCFALSQSSYHEFQRALESETDVNQKVLLICDYADQIELSNSKKHKELLDSASVFLKETLDSKARLFLQSRTLATSWYGQDADSCLLVSNQLVDELNKEHFIEEKARIHHSRGNIFLFKRNLERALEEYFLATEISQEFKNTFLLSRHYNNIGIVFRELGNYSLSEEYFRKSIRLSEQGEASNVAIFSWCNLGYVLIAQDKFAEALPYIDESISKLNSEDQKKYKLVGYYLKADICANMNELDSAEMFAKKALLWSEELSYLIGVSYSNRVLGDVYSKKGLYERAQAHFKKALSAGSNSSLNLYREEILMSEIENYKRQGNFEKSTTLLEELNVLKDNLNSNLSEEKIEAFENRSELQKTLLNSQNLKVESQMKSFRLLGALTLLIFISIICYVIFRAYRINKRQNIILEKAVEKRTQDLEEANEELKNFAYMTSHDLKEPIRIISSYSQLIQLQLNQGKISEGLKSSKRIEKSSGRLFILLKDIFDFISVREQKTFLKTKVNLTALNSEIKETFFSESLKTKISFEDNLPIIRGDKSQLSILFKNLIDNGLKYNKNEVPSVNISSKRRPQGQVEIIIADNGIGIEEKYFNQIFDLFKRLNNKDSFEGSGLGLAICKKITDIHNFNLEIESEVGKGSKFKIIIPPEFLV